MWTAGSRLLYHDDVPAHTALSVSSWQNIQLRPFHNPPIHLSSPLLTFLFPKLKITPKGRRFQTVEDFITNATNDFRQYHKHPSNSASKSGKGIRRGALLHKETILKGIILSKLQVKKDIIYRQISETS
jgi:hypothetical protein